MKNILTGFILGVCLTLTTGVFALSPFVGKEIQGSFPVFLNGELLEQEAIVIDGTSFLPVRLVADKLGLETAFENNMIFLNSKQKEGDEMSKQTETQTMQIIEYKMIPFQSSLDLKWTNEKVTRYAIIDDELYINLYTLGTYARYDRNTQILTFNFPNKDPIEIFVYRFPDQQPYEKGIDAFYGKSYMGTDAYIKVSALPISVTIEGGVMIIE